MRTYTLYPALYCKPLGRTVYTPKLPHFEDEKPYFLPSKGRVDWTREALERLWRDLEDLDKGKYPS